MMVDCIVRVLVQTATAVFAAPLPPAPLPTFTGKVRSLFVIANDIGYVFSGVLLVLADALKMLKK